MCWLAGAQRGDGTIAWLGGSRASSPRPGPRSRASLGMMHVVIVALAPSQYGMAFARTPTQDEKQAPMLDAVWRGTIPAACAGAEPWGVMSRASWGTQAGWLAAP